MLKWFSIAAVSLLPLVVASLLLFFGQSFCEVGETRIVCLREWANPLAAVFTIFAIIFGVIQLRDSRMNVAASVREGLVQLRDDLATELRSAGHLYSIFTTTIGNLILTKDVEINEAAYPKWHEVHQRNLDRVQEALLSFSTSYSGMHSDKHESRRRIVQSTGGIIQLARDYLTKSLSTKTKPDVGIIAALSHEGGALQDLLNKYMHELDQQYYQLFSSLSDVDNRLFGEAMRYQHAK